MNFLELSVLQNKVDAKVLERLGRDVSLQEKVVALHVEAFEFINQVGIWKWWKQNHKFDKERILDEMADIIAFAISFYITYSERENGPGKEQVFNELNRYVVETMEGIKEYDTKTLIFSISAALNEINLSASPALILAICLQITKNVTNATDEEIEEAYIKKSAENIKRQESNY